MLEFALGASVMIAAFAGTFRFGYTFYQYNALKNAVNAGARYASLRVYDSRTSTPSEPFRLAVANMVVYGAPSQGAAPVAPGLTTANVSVQPVFTNGVPTRIKVSIVNYRLDAVLGTSTLNGKPSATYPYEGIYSPY
jgi:Flp pilus assembly protein TadG